MKRQNKNVRKLAEGALAVAMAIVLSYFKIPVGLGFGGSIDFVMIPIIIYSVRWGMSCGLMSGLVFGTLKFFMAGGVAVNWESMLLDYSLAYMMVGLAGLFQNKADKTWLAALVSCAVRFLIHFFSGVTIYAEYMPDSFMGMSMKNLAIYSILYNGSYLLPNTVIALVVCFILGKSLKKYLEAADLK